MVACCVSISGDQVEFNPVFLGYILNIDENGPFDPRLGPFYWYLASAIHDICIYNINVRL